MQHMGLQRTGHHAVCIMPSRARSPSQWSPCHCNCSPSIAARGTANVSSKAAGVADCQYCLHICLTTAIWPASACWKCEEGWTWGACRKSVFPTCAFWSAVWHIAVSVGIQPHHTAVRVMRSHGWKRREGGCTPVQGGDGVMPSSKRRLEGCCQELQRRLCSLKLLSIATCIGKFDLGLPDLVLPIKGPDMHE